MCGSPGGGEGGLGTVGGRGRRSPGGGGSGGSSPAGGSSPCSSSLSLTEEDDADWPCRFEGNVDGLGICEPIICLLCVLFC